MISFDAPFRALWYEFLDFSVLQALPVLVALRGELRVLIVELAC